MRRLAAVLLFATTALAGCSDETRDQGAGPSPVPASVSSPLTSAPVCNPDTAQTALQIEALINQLFSGGNLNAALQRWDQIRALITAPPPHDIAAAQSNTYSLVGYTLEKFNQGQLNNLATPGGTGQAVSDLINLMFCYSGISGTVDPIGPDGAAALYQPGSPPLLLIAPSGFAGISLPSGTGTVTQPTVISLNRHQPDFPGPLLTQLDQYPLYYDFHTSSGETFLQDGTISVCLADNVSPADPSRLRLAHNVPEPNFTTIEILPPAPGFLNCTGAQAIELSSGSNAGEIGAFAVRALDKIFHRVAGMLGPQPLYASTLIGTGTTGTTKNLSPFGSVDTLAMIGALSPTSGLKGPEGGTVTPPEVLVSTPTDAPMAGITVTFTVTGGGGKLTAVGSTTPVTSVVTTTDAAGKATVGSWILGVGLNTVTAVADAPHLRSGIAPNSGVAFTATGNPATKLAFGTQPVTTTAGSSFSVSVLVQDVDGNTVPASSASVHLTLNAANGAVLGGTTTVAAVNGVATFSGLSITKAGTGYTLTASSSPLTSATSNSFSITAGSAANITINGGNNQTAPAGSILGTTAGTTAPSVKVTDQHGNPISGAGVTFQVASGGGSVAPTTATTDAGGIASTLWTIVAGSNTLDAWITALGNTPFVAFSATGGSTSTTLMNCLPTNGSSDDLSFPFYMKRPGKTLSQVTVYLSSNDPRPAPSQYTIQLIVGADSYGSTLATSTQTVLLVGSSSQNLATNFTFPNTALGTAQNITFRFNVTSNPTGARLTYNTGPCGLGNTKCNSLPQSCSTVSETSGTIPLPLSTFRRKGVAVKLIGG
ncbi:MAG TPA: hypothetical protein VGP80_10115 [Gemmatimonadales bacterium]|nr:hypothetical protein [Gemmatimonadales bacterium]